ncbi:putative tetratricopeptide repeat protein 25 [Monocercomonoides exilis]|uniref:putative tetratricopeptide repeat protein 25 n=1 Tax=Monocercomonoides exilis TaxID=2049356 RepID=UPI003559A7BF|nr:putative tetratricopeptide repeat protein 25 [Monocercomonoides exilis]|eukprot:MONOS_1283.1-p1 / transcript=MONOS_1283.1 / gene=MONOS_1283 / organism=Monocercomonoides_exilis_PA203 / gene_product=unspecified product / transcript_product=unspecified product / location=Mono_scaffold00022:44093-47556(+) / protein_length=972 / sequence_SO=supercontig / SO=protein_coding / is_pseudo=false
MYEDEDEEPEPPTQKQLQACAVDANTAKVHFKNGQYQKCIEYATKALQVKPVDEELLLLRSKAYEKLEKLEEALQDVDKVLENNASSYRALQQKADVLFAAGDFEYAMVQYHRGMIIRPDQEQFRLGVQKSKNAIEESNEQADIDANPEHELFTAAFLPRNLDMKTCRDLTSKLLAERTRNDGQSALASLMSTSPQSAADRTRTIAGTISKTMRSSYVESTEPLSTRRSLVLSVDVTQPQSTTIALSPMATMRGSGGQGLTMRDGVDGNGMEGGGNYGGSTLRESLVSPRRMKRKQEEEMLTQRSMTSSMMGSGWQQQSSQRKSTTLGTQREEKEKPDEKSATKQKIEGATPPSSPRRTGGSRKYLGHLADDELFLRELSNDPAMLPLSEKLKDKTRRKGPAPTPYFPKTVKPKKKKRVEEEGEEANGANGGAGADAQAGSASGASGSAGASGGYGGADEGDSEEDDGESQDETPKQVTSEHVKISTAPKPAPLNELISGGLGFLESRTEFWKQKIPPGKVAAGGGASTAFPPDPSQTQRLSSTNAMNARERTMRDASYRSLHPASSNTTSTYSTIDIPPLALSDNSAVELLIPSESSVLDSSVPLKEEDAREALEAVEADITGKNIARGLELGKILQSRLAGPTEDKSVQMSRRDRSRAGRTGGDSTMRQSTASKTQAIDASSLAAGGSTSAAGVGGEGSGIGESNFGSQSLSTIAYCSLSEEIKASLLCKLYQLMGSGYMDLQKFSLASIYLQNVLDIASSNDLNAEYEDALDQLGRVCFYLGDYTQASVLFEKKATQILQRAIADDDSIVMLYPHDGTDKIDTPTADPTTLPPTAVTKLTLLYRDIAQSLCEACQYPRAALYATLARQFAQADGTADVEKEILLLSARIAHHKEGASASLRVLFTLLERAVETEDTRTAQIAVMNMVTICEQRGDDPSVITFLSTFIAETEQGSIPSDIIDQVKMMVKV